MRLYLTIQRHQLPDTRILFNTSSRTSAPGGHQTIRTISDLLSAINAIVPLEADYAWGLEDYTVELHGYECLHFDVVSDVLKEGDEITVRGLTSDELRERRLGGRLQISTDGRHLVDGTSWGRRWRGGIGRPDVGIPPRKRRRLNEEVQQAIEDRDDGDAKRLEWVPATDAGQEQQEDDLVNGQHKSFMGFGDFDDEEEDEDDEDYQEDSEVESEDDQEDSSEGNEQGDIDRVEQLEHASSSTVEEAGAQPTTDDHSPLEITAEADFDNADTSDSDDEGEEDGRDDVANPNLAQSGQDVHDSTSSPYRPHSQSERSFAGFSSPVRSSAISTSRSDIYKPPALQEEQDNTLSSDTSSDTSQDDSSDSSSDSDVSDSVTSPDESIRVAEAKAEEVTATLARETPASASQREKLNVPPGEGMAKTRRNNERKKRSRLLARLKEEGALPSDADFQTLHRHLNPIQATIDEANEVEMMKRRREEIMSRLEARMETQTSQAAGVDVPVEDETSTSPITDAATVGVPDGRTLAVHPTEPSHSPAQLAEAKVAQKRTRLDVAGSRRMVFNSLGVRAPQTAAAEQAVREKLAEPARDIQSKERAVSKSIPLDVSLESESSRALDPTVDKTLWRRKLKISAVECVHVGRQIEVPSFPFKHPWQIRREKEQATYLEEYEELDYNEQLEQDDTQRNEDIVDIDTVADGAEQPSQTLTTSRTLTVGTTEQNDERVVVHDGLPALQRCDVLVGAKVAYKELHMNLRYEPEESPYRVATVHAVAGEIITLQLSLQDRQDAESRAQYDEDTGERIYSKFDMPEEEEVDDGIREMTFEQMIHPKLVNAGAEEIPRRGEHFMDMDVFGTAPRSQHEVEKPLSAPRQKEIASIIREAGFDSGIDEQTLQPMAIPGEELTNGPSKASGEHENHTSTTARGIQHSIQNLESSSPPSESIVESVQYPRLSLLDPVTTSSLAVKDSFPHEAQYVSPAPLLDDPTMLVLSHVDGSDAQHIHDGLQDSLTSEVAASLDEVQQSVEYSKDSGEATDDHHNPDDHVAESESVDSAGFPSLRPLTSSQPQRRSSSVRGKTSPPPAKRTGTTARQDSRSASNGGLSIKVSVSQQHQPRLSQIPDDTSIVNLISSSPSKDDEGRENISGQEKGKRRSAGRTASSQQTNSSRKALEGFGTSSLRKRTL